MKVKLVRQHNLKAYGFFRDHGGKTFNVIQKRDGGYDVDLAAVGRPGEWGWMYDGEVEIVDDGKIQIHIALNEEPVAGGKVTALCGSRVGVVIVIAVDWDDGRVCYGCYMARNTEKYRKAQETFAFIEQT